MLRMCPHPQGGRDQCADEQAERSTEQHTRKVANSYTAGCACGFDRQRSGDLRCGVSFSVPVPFWSAIVHVPSSEPSDLIL